MTLASRIERLWSDAPLLRRRAAMALVLVFLVSLLLPVGEPLTAEGERVWGWLVLILGWLGPLQGDFAWYDNVLFAISLAFLGHGKPIPLGIAIALVVLALAGLHFHNMPYDAGVGPMGKSFGFWLWILAMTGAGGLGLWDYARARSAAVEDQPRAEQQEDPACDAVQPADD